MNETIKEIWNKAASSHQQLETSWETKVSFLNRFAELIITECADVAEKAEPYKAHDLIKNHFGIK